MPFALIILVLIVAVASYFGWHREPAARARFLKQAALVLTGLFVAFFGLFIIGETIVEPGGWLAVGLIAGWTAPLIVLGVLAWYRPDSALPVFVILTGFLVALNVWFAVAPDGWRSFEDTHGPIRTIAAFAITAPLALLGWKRPVAAGMLLVVAGVAPLTLSAIGLGATGLRLVGTSLGAVSVPAVVTGILYLLSAVLTRHSAPPAGRRRTPDQPLKVA